MAINAKGAQGLDDQRCQCTQRAATERTTTELEGDARLAKRGQCRHGGVERGAFVRHGGVLPALVADRQQGFTQDLVGHKGLGDEVAAAGVIRTQPVVQFIVAGQKNHRHVTRGFGSAQAATGFVAIDAHAHFNVEKHDIRQRLAARLCQPGQRLLTRIYFEHFMAGGLQRDAEHARNDGVVIDDQDTAANRRVVGHRCGGVECLHQGSPWGVSSSAVSAAIARVQAVSSAARSAL